MQRDRIQVQSSFIRSVALDVQSRVFAFEIKDRNSKDGEEIFIEVSNPTVNIHSLLKAFLKSQSKGRFFNDVFLKRKSVLKGYSPQTKV